MSKKIRLGYDIISKRAIETESGVNIDDALRSISSYQKVPGVGSDNHPDVPRPSTKVLYIVKVASAGQPDTYKEWIWTQPSDGPGYWECTGDTTQDLSGYALKSEMSIEPGTGADTDKTTITLKEGTSATVLTAHQDLSGYALKSEMSVEPGTGSDADKTTITLKEGTSATVLTTHQDLSGKADKSEMGVSTNGDTTTITLKSGLSATVLNSHQDISNYVSVNQQSFTSEQKVMARANIGAAEDTAVQSVRIGEGEELKSGTTVTIPMAATGVDGAMSGSDKDKLDGIASQAQVNTIEHINAGQEELTPVSKTVTIPVFTGSDPGLVPSANASDADKALRGDGTWGDVSSVRVSYDSEIEQLWLDFQNHSDEVFIGGRWYKTVTIGSQVWMAENLDWKFEGLSDFSGTIYDNDQVPRGVYYNNDEATYGVDGNKYGLLYNGNVCTWLSNGNLPEGWRVPTTSDFESLFTAIGGTTGTADKLKSLTGWTTGTCTDTYGFDLKPAGRYDKNTNKFELVGTNAWLWSNTLSGDSHYYLSVGTGNNLSTSYVSYRGIRQGHSIRLVKDNT